MSKTEYDENREMEKEQMAPIGLPAYDRMKAAILECDEWARAGFPGATFEDLMRIASSDAPERACVRIRLRADRGMRRKLREFTPEELSAAMAQRLG